MYQSNELWNQLYIYIDYLKFFLVILGVFMVFTGRMLRRPATCISGYLAVVTVASIVYYARYPEVLKTQEMDQEAYSDRDYDNLIQYRLYFLWSSMFGIFAGLLTSWKE